MQPCQSLQKHSSPVMREGEREKENEGQVKIPDIEGEKKNLRLSS